MKGLASMIAPGTRLGPYVIAGPIGSSGMGEVYKATLPIRGGTGSPVNPIATF